MQLCTTPLFLYYTVKDISFSLSIDPNHSNHSDDDDDDYTIRKF